MRINMANALRTVNAEMHKQADGLGAVKSILGDVLHGARGVDLGRAATRGGTVGGLWSAGREGMQMQNLMNMAHPERTALMRKADQHAKTLAGGGTLDATQALEHQHGNMLKRMDQHLLKDQANPTKYMDLGQQVMHNPLGLAKAVGEEGATNIAKGFATGTAAHAAGQTVGQTLAARRARELMPWAVGAGALGGVALAKD